MSSGWNPARGLLLLALGASPGWAEFPVPEAPFAPRSYECRWTDTAPRVDGRPDEPCWAAAPWTEDFVDIRGGDWPAPPLRARARLLWDATHLFVAAELQEPDLWATYDRHDMVVYHEHDFELFLDPDGDNHHYYELEINALGTVWDLLLTAPYRDDGCAVDSWEIPGLQSAVSLDGTLNNPSDRDQGWTVELALPWAVLEETARRPAPPRPGDAWRLNFSRVEWHLDVVDGAYHKRVDPVTSTPLPEENWVWSPQGLVAMHYPERWGLLRFQGPAAADAGESPEWTLDELTAGEALMQVYYAQRRELEEHGICSDAPVGRGLTPAPGWTPVVLRSAGVRFTAHTQRADGLLLEVDERGRLSRRKLETRP
ncbi:MAG: carbohydrate-binding family 9-like protein [Candidatus Delongbacteria bacterium]